MVGDVEVRRDVHVWAAWSSADGLAWERTSLSPPVSGASWEFGQVVATKDGYLAIDTNTDGAPRGRTSADGLSWVDAPLAGLDDASIRDMTAAVLGSSPWAHTAATERVAFERWGDLVSRRPPRRHGPSPERRLRVCRSQGGALDPVRLDRPRRRRDLDVRRRAPMGAGRDSGGIVCRRSRRDRSRPSCRGSGHSLDIG